MDDNPDDIDPDFSDHEVFGNMGKMGLSIYRSVLRDGGTQNEAFSVTGAFFAGMMKGSIQSDDTSTD